MGQAGPGAPLRSKWEAVAALALGLGFLLAPGEAWAQGCGGTQQAISVHSTLTCSDGSHSQVRFQGQSSANITIIAPGGTATTISGTSTNPSLSIIAASNTVTGNYAIYVSARPTGNTGATGAASVTGSGRGINIDMTGGASGTSTVVLGSAGTIGSSTSSIGQHGIRVRGGPGAVTITTAGTIYATYEGIDAARSGAGTMTLTHTGAITSTSSTNSPGMLLVTQGTGPMVVTTSGDVTATTSTQRGIDMRADHNGPVTLTATGGTISSSAQGVFIDSRGTGAVTIQGTAASAPTQSGPTIMSSGSHGIHIAKSMTSATAGDVSITTTGGSITTGDGFNYGIYVQDNAAYTGTVAIDNRAGISSGHHAINVAARLGIGDTSITHRGGLVLSRTRSGIFVRGPDGRAGDVDINVMGGAVQAGPNSGSSAIRATGRGTGDVGVTIAAGATAISYSETGVYALLSSAAADDSQVTIAQNGRILGRSGVAVGILKYATAPTPVARTAQPLIDITWTGTFAAGTTAQTAPAGDLPTASSWFSVLNSAQDAEASEASGGAWDAPAGIEAQVMSWSTVANQVAQGDDPGAFADNAAQLAVVPTGATAANNAYVRQFRALLESDAFVVGSSLITAIDSTATSVSDLSDAELVTYLRTDDANIRGLLRNVLSQGLSDKEQAVLAALATGDSAGLTAALDDTDAGFSNAYKTAVRALLNRYNVGNVRVAMTAGSIDSRGDGIRAYYATQNDNNGAIDVTVAAGAEVTGARAGVWVANAGMGEGNIRKQTVTVNGMVTGGTGAGVHLIGGGTVRVGATGRINATSGDGILSDGGDLSVSVAGMVEGDIRGLGDGDLTADISGTVTGDIQATGGGDLTFMSRAGSRVSGTVHDPMGALTVAGSIGRLLYTNGGAVTVAQSGRLTGVGGEAIRSEAGDLSVTVDKGASITATGTGIYVANAGSSVRVVNRGTIEGNVAIDVPSGSTVEHLGGEIRSTDTSDNPIAIRFRGTEGNSLLKVALTASIDGDVHMLSGTVDLREVCPDNINMHVRFTDNSNPVFRTKSRTHGDCSQGGIEMEEQEMDDDDNGEGTNGGDTNGGDTNGGGTNGGGTNGGGTNGGVKMRTPNYSAFALTDDMLSDLTGSIHGAVVETEMRPGTAATGQVVWATPFGGARDQKGKGAPGVMDATHAFGGGLVGTSWGTRDVRVGGFIGGSVGQIDTQSNVSMQEQTMDMQMIFGGVYASHAFGTVLYDARMLVGQMTHDLTRRVSSRETAESEYSSLLLSPEVGVATTLHVTDTLDVRPRLRLRYAGLFTQGFRERAERADRWDVQYEKRTMHLVEGRAEVGVPVTLANGGQINPRVGVEGRWLLSGSKIKARSLNPDISHDRDAGGDDGVLTGTLGVGMSVPVADSMALVGSFDGALTTEDAWRATGYLGLTYSF